MIFIEWDRDPLYDGVQSIRYVGIRGQEAPAAAWMRYQ